MKEILSVLIMPLSIFWILLLLSGIFFILKRNRATKWLFFVSIGWLLIISTKFIPDFLVSILENKYPSLNETELANLKSPVYIMVFGAGHSDDQKLSPNDQLSESALGRLTEGIRLFRELSGNGFPVTGDRQPATGLKLILSGYAGRLSVSQAEVLSKTAIALGIDSANIEKLSTTKNTFDEAKTFGSRFGKDCSVVLVTDAVHMPRAIKLFRKAGLSPIPSPTNHLIKKSSFKSPLSWMPSSENIYKLEVAMHEYAGLLWARLGGD